MNGERFPHAQLRFSNAIRVRVIESQWLRSWMPSGNEPLVYTHRYLLVVFIV